MFEDGKVNRKTNEKVKKIRLIALDLDGTTLTRGRITKRTRRALEQALEQGIQVAIATGRVYSALPKDVFSIEGLRYVITSNGAQITDLSCGKIIYENCIAEEPLREVARLLRETPHPIEVFTQGEAYVDREVYEDLKLTDSKYASFMSRSYVLRTRKPVERIHDFLEDHFDSIENINVLFASQEEKRAMGERLGGISGITLTSSMRSNLEVGGLTTSKASGLAHLCQIMGLDMEWAMACGDSPNDMAMLREVGLGIAMGSGEDEVKAVADFVAPSNEEEGVAYAVERFALGMERPGWQLGLLKAKNRAAYKVRQAARRITGRSRGRR